MNEPHKPNAGLTENYLVSIQPNLGSSDPALRQNAFNDLVRTMRGQQEGWLHWKIPELVEHMVAEAVDDAFLKLWKELPKRGWETKWSLKFFQMVATRKGISKYRQFRGAKKRFGAHQKIEAKDGEEEAKIYGEVNPQIETRERRAEVFKIFEKQLEGLPLQQRRIAVLLLENNGKTLGPAAMMKLYREAHRKTLTRAAVKSTLAVVRKKLRDARAHRKMEE